MRFWKKFFAFIAAIVVMICVCFYQDEIGRLELSIFDKKISIGLYVVFTGLLLFYLIYFVLKSFFIGIFSFLLKNKSSEEIKSINKIANLIVLDNYNIHKNIEKISVVDRMNVLITAIILKNNIKTNRYIEKTGIPSIDILIVKKDLIDLIKKQNLQKAISLTESVIKKYPKLVNAIQDEILEIAKLAKIHSLNFQFDSRKFKYGLSRHFIETYNISLGMIEFESAPNPESKLKIIENIYKNYPNNEIVLDKYLDFIEEGKPEKYDDKKIIEIIKNSFNSNLNRKYAYNLLKIERKDVFEVAQEITKNINDNNLEKVWFLLIIATKLNFSQKVKELVKKIIEIDSTDQIFKFYVENYQNLKNCNNEILDIIGKYEYKI